MYTFVLAPGIVTDFYMGYNVVPVFFALFYLLFFPISDSEKNFRTLLSHVGALFWEGCFSYGFLIPEFFGSYKEIC